jgi:hypothetical protein
MKVLFLNHPWWVKDGDAPLRRGVRAGSRWPMTMESHYGPDDFRFGGYIPAPVFLFSAAGWLEQVCKGDEVSGHGMHPEIEVHVRDSIARGESYASCGKYLNDLKPDFIVVETATSSWDHDRRILRHIRQLLPQVQFIVAGTISSTVVLGADPSAALELEGVAAIVKGEYEKGCVDVVLGGSRGVLAHQFLTKEEMNGPNSRWPKWDEGCARNYWDANPKGQRPVQLQIWASRGCYWRCNFCAWPASMTNNDPDGTGRRSMRFYSGEYIESYIKERQRVMGPLGSCYFDDDTGNVTDKHTNEISDVMRHLGIPWGMMCRADTSSGATWQKMKDSGCFGVKIGFESGSQRVVDKIVGKKLDLKEARETAIWLRKIGLSVHGTFMVGLPGETPDERQETYNFIEQLYRDGGLDTHQLSGTALIDGTPLANLKPGETQTAYPDAKKDENYVEMKDGQLKAEMMTRALAVK